MSNDDGSRRILGDSVTVGGVGGVCIRIDSGGMEGPRDHSRRGGIVLTSNAVRPSYDACCAVLCLASPRTNSPVWQSSPFFRRLTRRDVSSTALPSQDRFLGQNGCHAASFKLAGTPHVPGLLGLSLEDLGEAHDLIIIAVPRTRRYTSCRRCGCWALMHDAAASI